MTTTTHPAVESVYARLSTWQARGVLLIAIGFLCVGLLSTPAPQPLYAESEHATADDMLLYLTEIQRMHAGENYYHVAAEELVAQGFPTRSVFNWRTPLPMWIMAQLPSPEWGRWILIAAGALMIHLSLRAATNENERFGRFALPLGLLLTSMLLTCLMGNVFVMTEVWAGMALALSIAAYGLDMWLLAVSMGLAALFLRELSLPYCGICLLLSIRRGRRAESVVWIFGLVAWTAYFALHCWMVAGLIEPNAIAHRQGWVQFGGLAFVLGTTQMNSFLLSQSMPWTVVYLTSAMLGLAGWSSRWGERNVLTLSAYLIAFSIVGQDFNRYWGFLTVPFLCYGAARAPASLMEIIEAASLRRVSPAGISVSTPINSSSV